MQKPLTCVFAIVLLVCPVVAWEKLGDKPEKFKGNVKSVRTKTNELTKESGEWVKQGESVETVEEISDRSESGEEETEDVDDDADSPEPVERDPIRRKQGEGYNAGYGTSHAGYGFYKIDEEDNILEAVHYSSRRELAGKDFHTYNASGNEIEKTSYSADGTLRSRRISSYEYDRLGNWVKRVEVSESFDSEHPTTMEVAERVILYR